MNWLKKKPKVEDRVLGPLPPYVIIAAINGHGDCGYRLNRLTINQEYEVMAFNINRAALIAAAEHIGIYIK